MTLVTLLTDFGTVDGYVGAMKGVISSLAGDAQIVDLTHDIPPQDVWGGAWALRQASSTYPAGTIHVAVVDPGVGSSRQPLLMRAAGQLYLGPDNGLFSWVAGAADAQLWQLDRAELFGSEVSATFHGRDIFASVAGHLAAGRPPHSCGTPTRDWERLTWPEVARSQDGVVGAVVHVDRFGNLISNIEVAQLQGSRAWRVWLGERDVGPLRETFADTAVGQWLAYVGSGGNVEIAVRNGRAASSTASRGEEVRLCRLAEHR